jgi:hypothetical protein
MHEQQNENTNDNDNPYGFIMDEPPKQKRTLIPKGESKKQRIIIMVGGGLALLTIILVIFSFISSLGGSGVKNLETLAKEQQEIIRVAELGERGATSTETKAFAQNAKLSVRSSQQNVIAYLTSLKIEVEPKQLSTTLNAKTDATLQDASDSGQFDEVFTSLLTKMLITYRANLTKYYNATDSAGQKNVLQNAYSQANDLINKTPEE